MSDLKMESVNMVLETTRLTSISNSRLLFSYMFSVSGRKSNLLNVDVFANGVC